MKINRFGKAEVLTPDQINLLFNEGFVKGTKERSFTSTNSSKGRSSDSAAYYPSFITLGRE